MMIRNGDSDRTSIVKSTSVGVSAEHEAEAMHDVVDDGMVVAFALVDHGHVVLGLLFFM